MRRGKPWPTAAMAAALAQAFQRALWPRHVPGGAARGAAAIERKQPPPGSPIIFAAAVSAGRASLAADASAAAAVVAARLGGRRPDVVQCLVAASGSGDRAAVVEAGRAALAGLGGSRGGVAFLGGAVSAVYDPTTRREAPAGVALWAACLPPGSAVSTFSAPGSSLPSLDGPTTTSWPAFLQAAAGDEATTAPPGDHHPNTVALILADAGFAAGAAELARRLAGALPADAAVAAGVLPTVDGCTSGSSVLLAGPTVLPPPGTRAVGVLMRAPGMAAGCVFSSSSASPAQRVGRELAAHVAAAADADGATAALIYVTPGAWPATTAGLAGMADQDSACRQAALVGGACGVAGEGEREEETEGAVVLVRVLKT